MFIGRSMASIPARASAKAAEPSPPVAQQLRVSVLHEGVDTKAGRARCPTLPATKAGASQVGRFSHSRKTSS